MKPAYICQELVTTQETVEVAKSFVEMTIYIYFSYDICLIYLFNYLFIHLFIHLFTYLFIYSTNAFLIDMP